VLTLKVLYRLPLRATQGLVASLLALMGLDLPTPSYTQVCRRQATLTVAVPRRKAARARPIVIDATGLKVDGEGEWKVRQQGVSKRRTWRTLHLTVDAATQEMVAAVLTENDVGDCEVVDAVLGQLEADAPIEQADADGAYDTRRTYRALCERGARVCIPPREKACPWKEQEGFEKQRNAAIEAIEAIGAHGKVRWKREVGYPRRRLAETAMFRIKTLFGGRLMARELDCQAVEAGIRVSALNTFTRLGMPESVCIG
jgi:predicted secreted protein